MNISQIIKRFFLPTPKKLKKTKYSVKEIAAIMNSTEPIDEDKIPKKFAKTMRQINCG